MKDFWDFLSSETFPTWMGRVKVASADFRVTYKSTRENVSVRSEK